MDSETARAAKTVHNLFLYITKKRKWREKNNNEIRERKRKKVAKRKKRSWRRC